MSDLFGIVSNRDNPMYTWLQMQLSTSFNCNYFQLGSEQGSYFWAHQPCCHRAKCFPDFCFEPQEKLFTRGVEGYQMKPQTLIQTTLPRNC